MIKYRIHLNQLLPVNPIVCEVGCAEGYFSQHMAEHWKTGKSYMVDNWGTIGDVTGDGSFPQEWHDMNYYSAKWKMYHHRHKTVMLRGLSHNMAKEVPDNSLDLLYLDANHSYEGVKRDLDAWYFKVKQGGVIAGHDFLSQAYGVRQAVEEFAKGFILNLIPEDKEEDAGFYFINTKKC